MTLRWRDSALLWAGRHFPALAERLLARIYGSG